MKATRRQSDPQPVRVWWCEADAIGYPKLRCTERAPHGPSCGWRNLPDRWVSDVERCDRQRAAVNAALREGSDR